MGATRTGLLILTAVSAVFAEQTINTGWNYFYNLEYDDAIKAFAAEIASDPQQPEPYNHLAQAILYRQMYRSGALDSDLVTGTNSFTRREKMNLSPEDRKRFADSVATAIRLASDAVRRNSKDTGALYSLGVSYALRANYEFLVDKSWLAALRDFGRARKLHHQVMEIDPRFTDALLIEGLHDYVIGCLPFGWRMVGAVAGFHGDKAQGIRELRAVAENGRSDRADARSLLTAIYRREHRSAEAIPLLKGLIREFPRNYLYRFELSRNFADAGDETSALRVLDEIERLKREGAAGYTRVPQERIAFARGNLLFWYKHFDRAADQLRTATAGGHRVALNTRLMAEMRLGQTLDLLERREEAKRAYQTAINLAPDSAIAKQCAGYLRGPYRRD